jgi:pseudomonalisin
MAERRRRPGRRQAPDVALTAAVHDGYLIFMNGDNLVSGGTSAASPSFAGLMALVVENRGARQGNPNAVFYSLANDQRFGGAAVFHDVTAGNNSVPGVSGFSAVKGYDLASGLGSVDASVLVNHWKDAAGPAAIHLSLSSGALTVTPGGASEGFNAPVTLAVKGLPSGISATAVPASLAAPGAGTSVLTLTATKKAAAGRYTVTVAATEGSVTQDAAVSLTVN